MTIKEDLKQKTPSYVSETTEFHSFLKWVSENKITTSTQLKSVLNTEIKELQSFLEKDMHAREGTNSRVQGPRARRLDFLKLARDKIVKYL